VVRGDRRGLRDCYWIVDADLLIDPVDIAISLVHC